MILKNKTYHFYEFAISGLSGSGKSTLIAKLLEQFKNQYKIFYAKHDAHRFEIDHPGKDTFVALNSGAQGISIYNQEKWATIQSSPLSLIEQKLLAIDYDFTLVEGHKHTDIPKLIFLDEKNEIEHEYQEGKLKSVLGFIGTDHTISTLHHLPYFHRDDVKSISNFILNYFHDFFQSLPLNALILVGGKSSRMGHDKAKINYHGDYQGRFLANLLKPHCQNIFFSCREDQADEKHIADFPKIVDQFNNLGPTGGILSYFQKNPLSRVLVAACDMPLIDENSIKQLINEESPFKLATVFINKEKKWPEPLFSIYQPKAYARLLQLLSVGHDCPMKMLFNSDIKKITPQNFQAIANINTPEEMELIKNYE